MKLYVSSFVLNMTSYHMIFDAFLLSKGLGNFNETENKLKKINYDLYETTRKLFDSILVLQEKDYEISTKNFNVRVVLENNKIKLINKENNLTSIRKQIDDFIKKANIYDKLAKAIIYDQNINTISDFEKKVDELTKKYNCDLDINRIINDTPPNNCIELRIPKKIKDLINILNKVGLYVIPTDYNLMAHDCELKKMVDLINKDIDKKLLYSFHLKEVAKNMEQLKSLENLYTQDINPVPYDIFYFLTTKYENFFIELLQGFNIPIPKNYFSLREEIKKDINPKKTNKDIIFSDKIDSMKFKKEKDLVFFEVKKSKVYNFTIELNVKINNENKDILLEILKFLNLKNDTIKKLLDNSYLKLKHNTDIPETFIEEIINNTNKIKFNKNEYVNIEYFNLKIKIGDKKELSTHSMSKRKIKR